MGFNLHTIKRQARKEAWYGDSYNPFKKNMRSNTWSRKLPDIEADISEGEPLSASQTEPPYFPQRTLTSPEESKALPNRPSLSQEIRDTTASEDAGNRISVSEKQMQIDLVTGASWELDEAELSWDPFGSLSEELTKPGYLHRTVRALHNRKMVRSAPQLRERDIDFNGTRPNITTTQNIKPQLIDVHLFTVTTTSVQPMVSIHNLSDLFGSCTTKYTQGPSARLFIARGISPFMVEEFSKGLGCSVEVFNDHLRPSSEDVALILPSASRRQSHVVIPYRRTYQLSTRKETRECRNLRSSFSHGGLVTTEEHVTFWVSSMKSGSWTGLILCDPDPIQSGNRPTNEECMRSRFEAAIKSLSALELLAEPFTFVRVVLQLVSKNWINVIRDQESYMLPGLKPQYTGATDERLLEKESFGEYLKQTLGMLKIDLQIFQTLRAKYASRAHDLDELLIDYEFLLSKASVQIEQNTNTIPIITAMIAVEDNRKAIQQANDVKALTTLATVYIPLSFVAGIFGMNVTQLNPNPLVNIPLWLYFATALPITAVSMLVVWYGALLLDGLMLAQQKFHSLKDLWFSSKNRNIMESPMANALANGGSVGILAGPGKPSVNYGDLFHPRK